MLWAAGEEAPHQVFSHGFVYVKNEESGEVEKISKSLGNVVEPMEIIQKFSADAFRYYFLRECIYHQDGEFSWRRFADVYNSELANTLGNTLSRCSTLILKNYSGTLDGTAGWEQDWSFFAEAIDAKLTILEITKDIVRRTIDNVEELTSNCQYSQAIIQILHGILGPTNQYLEFKAPWKLVKVDREETKRVLFNAAHSMRIASILLKPFIPTSAKTIYTSFNFPTPWDEVKYADAAELKAQPDDLRVTAELVDGKVKPLFPRIA